MKNPTPVMWIMVLLVFAASAMLQINMYLNADVSWLLDVTHRFLMGGTYYHQFVAIEPPMVLLVYLPAVLFTHHVGGDTVTNFCLYSYVLASLSLFLCDVSIRKYCAAKLPVQRILLIFGLAFIYLIVAMNELGDISSFSLIFCMPYFCLAAWRFSREDSSYRTSTLTAIVIGLMAAIGFGLWPCTLINFLLIEALMVARFKQWRIVFRAESITIIAVTIVYAVYVFVMVPEYIDNIVPLVVKLYRYYQRATMGQLFSFNVLSTVIGIGLLVWYLRHKNPMLDFAKVLLCAIAGYFLVYVIQMKAWYSVWLPVFSIVFVLALMLVPRFIREVTRKSVLPGLANKLPIMIIIAVYSVLLYSIVVIFTQVTRPAVQLRVNPVSPINQLLNFIIDNNYNGPIYVFSEYDRPSALIALYAGLESASRFPDFWMVNAMRNKVLHYPKAIDIQKFRYFTREVRAAVIEDFQKNPPNIVFIAQDQLDYLHYFLRDPRFKKIWKQYHYKTTVAGFKIYLIGVTLLK